METSFPTIHFQGQNASFRKGTPLKTNMTMKKKNMNESMYLLWTNGDFPL